MERHGVIVLALPLKVERIDALSTMGQLDIQRPVMMALDSPAGDRVRFSVAHELGHLILHRGVLTHTRETEHEANLFEAEFLLPERRMREVLPEALNLSIAMELKREWRVSMQILIRRARDVGVITESRYRRLFQLLSARSWRTVEPIQVPFERTRLLRQMAEMRFGVDYVEGVAQELRIDENFSSEILEQFAPAPKPKFLTATQPYEYQGELNQNN